MTTRAEQPGSRSRTTNVSQSSPQCPYPGPRPYGEQDAPLFFGRERFVDKLAKAILRGPLVAVIGPAGYGKTSVLEAGLFPRLRAESGWSISAFRPRRQPFLALASALAPLAQPQKNRGDLALESRRLADQLSGDETSLGRVVTQALKSAPRGQRLLLVVDQCEELFQPGSQDDEVRRFMSALLALSHEAGGQVVPQVTTLIALRADALEQALGYRGWADMLEGTTLKLGPLSPPELEQAIVEPARQGGRALPPELVQRLLDDMQPGKLPLLQFALAQLWRKQPGGRLTLAAYDEIGGLGALVQHAEKTYAQFNPLEQAVVKQLFVAAAGKPGAQSALAPEDDARWPVAARLIESGVLVSRRDELMGEEYLALADGSLARDWPDLRAWIDEDRELIAWHSRLRSAMQQWLAADRDERLLLQGTLLLEAARWIEQYADALDPAERSFIFASQERNAGLAQRWISLDDKSRQQRQVAIARHLTAQAELLSNQGVQMQQGVLLAVEAMRRWPMARADRVLRHGIAMLPRPLAHLKHESGVTVVCVSPDGSLIATGSHDGRVRIWDGKSDGAVVDVTHAGAIEDLAFSPDGRLLGVASADGMAGVWRTRDGLRAAVLAHGDPVHAIAFSPDGRYLATACRDGMARLWDASSGAEVARMAHGDCVNALAFSQDGKCLATAGSDRSARVWRVSDGAELARTQHRERVTAVAFSPDGRYVASASNDRTVAVWRASTGQQVALLVQKGAINAVAFSPGGRYLAVGGDDRSALVWDVAGHHDVLRVSHLKSVLAVLFSPDERYLATASRDGTARVWDMNGGQEVACMEHDAAVKAIAFSPDGHRLVTGSLDGAARVWETASARPAAPIRHKDVVAGIAFSPDERFLASASWDRSARVRDIVRHDDVATVRHDGNVNAVSFSPDGRWLATASGSFFSAKRDDTVRLWDTREFGERLRLAHDAPVRALAFSPDGSYLATASEDHTMRVWEIVGGIEVGRVLFGEAVGAVAFGPDGRTLAIADGSVVRLWDVAGNEERLRLEHDGRVNGLAFSPDGAHLATASSDQAARIWSVETGSLINQVVHDGAVKAVAFSADGRYLATGSEDKGAYVYDAQTCEEVAVLMHDEPVVAVAFSPSGRYLATAGYDNAARTWLLQPEDLIREACSRLTRNLTVQEWQQYLGDDPYRPTCPDL